MAVKINNIILSIDDDISEVKIKAAKRLNISSKDFKSFKILRESIDARKKILLNSTILFWLNVIMNQKLYPVRMIKI